MKGAPYGLSKVSFYKFWREEATLLSIKNSYLPRFSVEINFSGFFSGVITVLVRQVGNNEDS